MRKLLITVVAFLTIASSFAASATEVLITEEGSVFSVGVAIIDETTIPATTAIMLTVQENLEVSTSFIPATENGFMNIEPAIAWDDESDTLFAFWLNIRSIASSELLVASLKDGVWSEPWSLGTHGFHYRSNLEIATTSYVTELNEDGDQVLTPGLRVHLVWWDQDGHRSAARYGLLTIENGEVVSTEIGVLEDLIDPGKQIFSVDIDPYQMQHPQLSVAPDGAAVTIVFADELSASLHAVDVTPIAHGVLTIPIGFRTRTAPRMIPAFAHEAGSKLAPAFILSQQDTDRMIAYVRHGDVLRYRDWNGTEWNEEKGVSLGGTISAEAAISALKRLIDSTRTKGVLTIPIG